MPQLGETFMGETAPSAPPQDWALLPALPDGWTMHGCDQKSRDKAQSGPRAAACWAMVPSGLWDHGSGLG